MLHLFLHFLVPLIIAIAFWRNLWRRPYLLMLCSFVIDLDHLLATPIYDPQRCSIGFHPLHSEVAIGVYVVLLVAFSVGSVSEIQRTARIVLIGVAVHLVLDGIDCFV